ncbi:hypothetical protein Spb1_11150 [Planctopirus ephydatiae]|uniref:Uncharacterized protein n=1 Tax=Planctopirus ephydatiae TaxID=2528019 RepID=A0A518GL20_9PLAN|nr:hypothetical protein [Planctopirus ephydatiae]QDV29236.1 hypothetical protein Spb1_11150 [Planctopirus ephydatiae]
MTLRHPTVTNPEPTDEELLAWLDETVSLARSAQIEHLVRQSAELQSRLNGLRRTRQNGSLTLGEIWRCHRVGCFSWEILARYARNESGAGLSEQIRFHLETVECVWCQAVWESLSEDDLSRTDRVFQTSAGQWNHQDGSR